MWRNRAFPGSNSSSVGRALQARNSDGYPSIAGKGIAKSAVQDGKGRGARGIGNGGTKRFRFVNWWHLALGPLC
jgi:hypothetical protein